MNIQLRHEEPSFFVTGQRVRALKQITDDSLNKIVCEAGDEGVVENIDEGLGGVATVRFDRTGYATDIFNDECEAV